MVTWIYIHDSEREAWRFDRTTHEVYRFHYSEFIKLNVVHKSGGYYLQTELYFRDEYNGKLRRGGSDPDYYNRSLLIRKGDRSKENLKYANEVLALKSFSERLEAYIKGDEFNLWVEDLSPTRNTEFNMLRWCCGGRRELTSKDIKEIIKYLDLDPDDFKEKDFFDELDFRTDDDYPY